MRSSPQLQWRRAQPNFSNTDTCQPQEPSRVCTLVNTEVTLTHSPDLESQVVQYELLKRKDDVAASIINSGFGQLNVYYVGDVSLATSTVITMQGVPESEMGTGQTEFFQKFARSFLNRQMKQNKDSSREVEILTVRVEQQKVYTVNRNLRSRLLRALQGHWQRHRGLPISSGTTIDVTTTITGEHRPPPHIEFDSLVEDSIDRNGQEFQQDLKTEATQALDEDEALFFKEVQEVTAWAAPTAAPTTVPTTMPTTAISETNVPVIVGSVMGALVALLALGAVLFFVRRQRKQKEYNTISNVKA